MASMLLDRTIAAPVRRLSAAAEHVSQSITASTALPDLANRRDEVGQMADAFQRMTAALYRRIEASEKFAADVAHELKNPLAAARSTADALSYARTSEQREVLVQQIQAELKRLNRLITDVSNASRLDAELARQTNEPVDLAQVLTTVVDALQGLHIDEDKSIVLDLRAVASSDPFVVKGHEGRLGQVITNLVDNAISFAPEGGKVEVIARRDGNEIEVSIEDDGPGILEDKLEKIFERFYSDRPQSDRTKGKNSGLGLSISREIIEAHGGRIWAENRRSATGEMGHGARFVIRLPSVNPTAYRTQASAGWRP
jgi:two-component system sensor histidine kinase ChvG